MIGIPPSRGAAMDPVSMAFAPINALNQQTMSSLGILDALQNLSSRPQLQQQQQIDSFLRAAGDLLPPGALEQLLMQRLPGFGQSAPAASALPPGIDPAQLQMMQQILSQQ